MTIFIKCENIDTLLLIVTEIIIASARARARIFLKISVYISYHFSKRLAKFGKGQFVFAKSMADFHLSIDPFHCAPLLNMTDFSRPFSNGKYAQGSGCKQSQI